MKPFMIATAFAMLATPSYAKDNTRLPEAMLGGWCPVKSGAHIYLRSADPIGTSDECMIIKTIGYQLIPEGGCDFVRIRRQANNYIVDMKCFAEGDNENTGRRYRQVERARPMHTSVFQLDREHLSVKKLDAAPKLPKIFHGQWCGEFQMMKRCIERESLAITANGFSQDEIGCDLVHLTPQRPTRRDIEYRATFQCVVGADTKSHRRYYWIGFYGVDHRNGLFMQEANSTFTGTAWVR